MATEATGVRFMRIPWSLDRGISNRRFGDKIGLWEFLSGAGESIFRHGLSLGLHNLLTGSVCAVGWQGAFCSLSVFSPVGTEVAPSCSFAWGLLNQLCRHSSYIRFSRLSASCSII